MVKQSQYGVRWSTLQPVLFKFSRNWLFKTSNFRSSCFLVEESLFFNISLSSWICFWITEFLLCKQLAGLDWAKMNTLLNSIWILEQTLSKSLVDSLIIFWALSCLEMNKLSRIFCLESTYCPSYSCILACWIRHLASRSSHSLSLKQDRHSIKCPSRVISSY